jgi:hypothetical protein
VLDAAAQRAVATSPPSEMILAAPEYFNSGGPSDLNGDMETTPIMLAELPLHVAVPGG